MKLIGIATAVMIFGCMAIAQDSGGTVNSMSNDPQQNQKATGAMGTTTGQPNDVTPGSSASPNGGVPNTRTMTGSDSNGNLNQGQTGSTSTASSQRAGKQSGKKMHNKNKANATGQSAPTGGSSASQTDMGATHPQPGASGSASPNAGSPPPQQ